MSKRREFSAQFKLEAILEGLRGEKSIAQLCRERNAFVLARCSKSLFRLRSDQGEELPSKKRTHVALEFKTGLIA